MPDDNRFLRHALPHIGGLHPYVPGFQPKEPDWVKLNTNENPYPPSPRVAAAIGQAAETLPKYPDPRAEKLRAAVAQAHRLPADAAIIGNGSDDILNLLMRVFVGSEGQAIGGMMFPSYSLYPVLAAIQNGQWRELPFSPDMALPVDEIAACGAKIFFLTSPNAPTGVGFAMADIRRLAKAFDGVLVVDEAYAAFAKQSATDLLGSCDNVVVTRTFSKSHGLAGLRVGYALAHPDLINLLDRVRDSYNVNALSQAGALAALGDDGYYLGIVRKIVETREFARGELLNRGWEVYPSQANFLFARPVRGGKSGPNVAQDGFAFLRENRILVRYFGNHPFTADYLRISVGTDDDMVRLLEVIDQWQSNA